MIYRGADDVQMQFFTVDTVCRLVQFLALRDIRRTAHIRSGRHREDLMLIKRAELYGFVGGVRAVGVL